MSGKLNVITVIRLVKNTARIEKIILYSRKHHKEYIYWLIHLYEINNSKVLLTNKSDIVKQLDICDKEMLLTSLEAIKMIVYDIR